MPPIQISRLPQSSHRIQPIRRGLWWGFGLIATLALASCGAINQANKAKGNSPELGMPAAAPAAVEGNTSSNKEAPSAKIPPSRPQLIKSAQITLQVKSIEDSLKAVNLLSQKTEGDILELQDLRSGSDEIYQTVFIKMRVPQEKLEMTLDAIAQLGTVRNRSIKAEDVSSQLVDLQARLKNLRQTEVQLQNILQQTGSVGDVLKVTQELSRVRESIEQLDATVTNLKSQVAYSTIEVRLSDTVIKPAPQRDLGSQVQDTWQSATNAVAGFSLGLLKLSLWLLVFAPYWLVPLGLTWYWRSRHRKSQQNDRSNTPKEPDIDIIEM
ncbi:MAG: DUF4349 domain-containing protein [Pseudanabaena sp. ELA607]